MAEARARVELWGWPVGHSLSPAMQEAGMRALGLDWEYRTRAVEPAPGTLEGVVAEMRALGPLQRPGANVTVPHKAGVAALLDRLDPTAEELGAVNTVAWTDGMLVGHDTDPAGAEASIRRVATRLSGGSAVVLGCGGAALACVAALRSAGAGSLRVVARRPGRARRAISLWGDGDAEVLPWPESWARVLEGADILVQATSVGLDGEVSPLPPAEVPAGCAVFDCVYHRRQTALVRGVQARGGRALDGLLMLWAQGAAALGLWTGSEPPAEAMRLALEESAGRPLAPGLDG